MADRASSLLHMGLQETGGGNEQRAFGNRAAYLHRLDNCTALTDICLKGENWEVLILGDEELLQCV